MSVLCVIMVVNLLSFDFDRLLLESVIVCGKPTENDKTFEN